MSTLTQFFPKSSDTPIGEIRVIATGLYNSPATITAPDGGVWLRENSLFPISAYPEAAVRFAGAGGAYTFSNQQPSSLSGATPRVTLFANNTWFVGITFADSYRSQNGVNNLTNFSFSSGSTNNVNCVTFGGTRWAIGGGTGWINTTTNLSTFSASQVFSGIRDVNSIAYGNGVYVAGSNSNSNTGQLFVTSTDGVTWTTRTGTNYNGSKLMAFGQGKFVSISYTGRCESSTDGITWTGWDNLNGSSGDRNPYEFSYANGTYVAVGYNNSSQGMIITSTDGEYWTTRAAQTNTLFSVTYGAGTWVAGGNFGYLVTSTDDGATWTPRSFGVSQTINRVIYGDKFVAVGNNSTIRTSTDGITWTARSTGMSGAYNDIVYAAPLSRYVLIGSGGIVAYSTDAITWTNNYNGSAYIGEDMNKVAYGNGVFIAGGTNQRMMKSTDGITWSRSESPSALEPMNYQPYIAYNPSSGVFGMTYVYSQYGNFTVYTSTNGDVWRQHGNDGGAFNPSPGSPRLFGWSVANGKFWGHADWNNVGGIWSSTDGVWWNNLPSTTSGAQYNALAFGNNLWVCVGATGNIYTSTDGKYWTARPSPLSDVTYSGPIKSVAYNPNTGLWVYAGTRCLGCSTDGITWRELPTIGNLNSTYYVDYAAVAGGIGASFYCVGSEYTTSNAYFFGYSPDPTVPYCTAFDASEYFYVPAISQGTYTVGSTSTGTSAQGAYLTTRNMEGVAYVKGK